MNPTNEQELRKRIVLKLSAKLAAHTPLGDTEILNAASITAHLLPLIQSYTNAEIAKVLERLEAELNEQKKAAETNLAYHVDVTKNERLIRDWQGTVHGIEFCRPAIAAERAKLKEVK